MADIALATPDAPSRRSARPPTWDQLRTNRNWLGFWFMLPAMAFLIFFLAYPLGLGIWISFTDAQDRAARRIHRHRELRVAVGQFDLLALGVQHAALHHRRQRHQIRDRALSRAAAEREHAVQGDAARAGADPLHRADRAVGAGVLVDLRFAILDHLVVAQASRPDHPEHQFPRRRHLGADLRDLRQYLARRSLRRDHAAGRPADRAALALRGRNARRRQQVGDVPLHHLSAADPDHRGGDDVLGAVHLHRLPADLGDDARRPGQRHPSDGDLVVSARHHRRPARRGRRDLERDDPVPAGRDHGLLVRLQRRKWQQGENND